MKRVIRWKKRWIAWGVGISLVVGMIFIPLPKQDVQAQVTVVTSEPYATDTVNLEPSASATVSEKPLVSPPATIKPSATPLASEKPSPLPTASMKPVLTPNPKASLLFGSVKEDEQITMYVGDNGVFDIDRSNTELFTPYLVSRLTRLDYRSSNSGILVVDGDGKFQALGVGQVTVTVTGYNENYHSDYYGDEVEELFERDFSVTVYPDMSGVKLEKTSVTLYYVEGSYNDSSVSIKISSSYILDQDDERTHIDISSSNKKMYVTCSIKNNVITLESSTPGTTDITLVINGKEYVIHLKVVSLKLSATSLLLVTGKTKQLKVNGVSEKIRWKSSNSQKVSVNSKGKVKAKRQGNAIITAKVGNSKLGCVVSVTNSRKKKVIARANKIVRTSKYSQAKRMQKGYYDCSSLVWRSYSAFGYKIGAASYAPTAADQGQWFAGKNRLLKGGYSQKNVQNLKLNAGDLLFETGAKNGRYKGIYHVEMFTGYEFYGFDESGKPIVLSKWANRPDGYYWYGCGIVGKM